MDTPDDDDAYITDIGVGVMGDASVGELWVVMIFHLSSDPDPVHLFFAAETASTLAEMLATSAMVAWGVEDPLLDD